MVRARLAEPTTPSKGFILDGFPRTMPPGRGAGRHPRRPRRVDLDAVVELAGARGRASWSSDCWPGPRDDTEDVIRNRQQVYRDETAPLLDHYRAKLRQRRRRRLGRGDHGAARGRAAQRWRPERGSAVTRGRGSACARCCPVARPGHRAQEPGRARRDAGRRGARRARPWPPWRAPRQPGVSTGRARRARRADHPGRRRRAVVPRLPRLPGVDLRVGERADRARHPVRRAGPRRRRPDLGRLRGDPRRLARRRGRHRSRSARSSAADLAAVGRLRGGAGGRDRGGRCPDGAALATSRTPCRRAIAGGRRAATAPTTASSRSTAGTASARRCTWTRSCPTTASPGHGPRLRPGMALAVEPMLTAGDPETGELDDGWTVVTADGRGPRTGSTRWRSPSDGPRILTLPAD